MHMASRQIAKLFNSAIENRLSLIDNGNFVTKRLYFIQVVC